MKRLYVQSAGMVLFSMFAIWALVLSFATGSAKAAIYDDFNTGTTIDTSKWTIAQVGSATFSQHDGKLYFSSSVTDSSLRLIPNPIAGEFKVMVEFYNFSSDTTYPSGYQGKTSGIILGMGPTDDQVIITRMHGVDGEAFSAVRNAGATGPLLEAGGTVGTSSTQGMLSLIYSNGTVEALYNLGLDPNAGWISLGTLHPNWSSSYVPSFYVLGANRGTGGATSFQIDNVTYGVVSPLYAHFSGYGLYSWNGTTWTQIGTSQPLSMTASGSALYATFSGVNGLYNWDGAAWTKFGDTAPASIVASGSTLYAHFSGYGLYTWNGTTWTQIGTSQPLSMTASGSALYATFSGVNGIYRWDGSTWTKFGDTAPAMIAAAGSTLYAYFTGYGLYTWNGTTWTQIGTSQPSSIVTSGSMLYATFSGVNGIYKFDGSTWTKIGDTAPAAFTASGTTLYGYYAGYGLYSWNGSTWTQLGTSQPAIMVAPGD